jgi:hypothetical protein
VHLRFGSFHRIEQGRIVESRVLVDLPGLAAQAGRDLLPPGRGRVLWVPGPMAGDGVLDVAQDPAESAATLGLIEAMVFQGCNALDARGLESMGMARYWTPDMVWHGPHGIGSAIGFTEFQDNAQGPSVAAFPDRRGGHHRTRFAEGGAGGFVGWPSLRGTFSGAPFLGVEPTGRPIGMRIMDFYIRRGDRLAENFVLIDLVDWRRQVGAPLPLVGP